MTADPLGRIWPRSGSGSLSGQYMMHGAVGSVEMLRTRPPAESACPDGVSSGYVGVCGFAFSVSGPSTPVGDCGADMCPAPDRACMVPDGMFPDGMVPECMAPDGMVWPGAANARVGENVLRGDSARAGEKSRPARDGDGLRELGSDAA